MSEEKKKSPFSIYWIYAALGVALIAFQIYMNTGGHATIKYRETFFNLVDQQGVKNVRIINQSQADFKLTAKGLDIVKKATKGELAEMKKPNKMTIMLPSRTSSDPDNIDFSKVIDMKCNIIAMRYQKNDQQLANYNSIFAESAFIPKDGLQLETIKLETIS